MREYDLALVQHFGASARSVTTLAGTALHYATTIPKVKGPPEFGGAVPIQFGTMSDVLTPAYLPSIVITRTDPEIEGQRLHSFGVAWRVPTDAARLAGIVTDAQGNTGYSDYEETLLPHPWTLRYTIYARSRPNDPGQIHEMGKFLYRKMPLNFVLCVIDSENEERQYHSNVTSQSTPNELEEILRRQGAWSFDIEVHGEMEYALTVTSPAMTQPAATVDTRED